VSGRLQGLGVVLTRPRVAAEALAAPLQSEGARVFLFPALGIEPIAMTPQLESLLARIDAFDLAVFVSANAAEHGLEAVRKVAAWPAHLEAAAVGEATADALRNSGLSKVISPAERHDSEGLLALPRLNAVKGQNIVVFRGEGGREAIRETLEARGARVEYAECYRRVKPATDAKPLVAAWQRGEVHAVSVLSAETLRNFVAMLGADGAALAGSATLVVPHPAIAAGADARRFARVEIAGHGASALIEALSRIRVTS
jgi:uroporphyrinogen-III synthase